MVEEWTGTFDLKENAIALHAEMAWLENIFRQRFRSNSQLNYQRSLREHESAPENLASIGLPPSLSSHNSTYAWFVNRYELDGSERLLLILILANHIQPGVLDIWSAKEIILEGMPLKRPETGFIQGPAFQGKLPTGQTYAYLMGHFEVHARLKAMSVFLKAHPFAELGILSIEPQFKGEPTLHGMLMIDEAWVEFFLFGKISREPTSIKYSTTEIQSKKDKP